MAFATLNGITLHYRLGGASNGTPLVLVNSLGTDLRIWDEVVERLAGTFRILAYDKRGHGLTDAPPAPYSLDDHVADLLALTSHVGFSRFALAGVSVGGLIAQGFAVRHQARLTALVLCDTAARLGSVQSWQDRIEKVRAGGIASIGEAIIERWFSPAFRQTRPQDYAGWRNLLERTPADGYVGTCMTLRDTDLTVAIAAIAVPTLVICGEEDQSTPLALVRETAGGIPNARFEVIPGVGHLPSIEAPDRLAALIAEHAGTTVAA